MSISRALAIGALGGTAITNNLHDTVNWLSGQALGRLQSVAGTNAITATLNEDTGFSAWATDAYGVLVPANNNTGAVTLQIQDTASPPDNLGSAIGVRNNEGDALEEDDLVAGKAYPFQYDSADGFIRIMPDVPSQSGGSDTIGLNRQVFTTSGTWTKPSNLPASALVFVELWGGGGGGNSGGGNGGGGGGAYNCGWFLASDLSATETVTVATAAAVATAGGKSSFGSHLEAYGGGTSTGSFTAGGGGGGAQSVGGNGASTGGAGGNPSPGSGGSGNARGGHGNSGGGGSSAGGSSAHDGGDGIFGGGGGGTSGAGTNDGGKSQYGGGGGAGSAGSGGVSQYGGNGGDAGVAGTAPGGGGGTGAAGARGEVRVYTFG